MSLRPRLSCFGKAVSCFMYMEVKAIPLTLGPAGPGGPGDPWAPYGLKHAISLAGFVAYGNVVRGRRKSGDPYLIVILTGRETWPVCSVCVNLCVRYIAHVLTIFPGFVLSEPFHSLAGLFRIVKASKI